MEPNTQCVAYIPPLELLEMNSYLTVYRQMSIQATQVTTPPAPGVKAYYPIFLLTPASVYMQLSVALYPFFLGCLLVPKSHSLNGIDC